MNAFSDKMMDDVNSIDLPPSVFDDTPGLEAGILFGFYATSSLFPLRINKPQDEGSTYKTIGSAVIAARIAGQKVENLVQPALIKLTIIPLVRSHTVEHTTSHLI